MNQLNSVIIEGDVNGDLVEFEAMSIFYIESTFKDKKTVFEIGISGRLKDITTEELLKNNSVRIVGRVAKIDDRFFIKAEHIEFKKGGCNK